jgi:outer membrane receptor for ferrienterochelin and colicin
LSGTHNFGNNQQHKIDWAGSFSLTYMAQPDLKFLNNAYVETSEGISYSIQPSIGLIPTRYWRNMNENTSSNTLDYTLNFKNWNGKKSSFKTGLALDWKYRNFDEYIYQFESLSNSFNGSFSSYFADENMISSSNPKGVFVTDGSNPKNNYTASSVVLGSYAMTEIPIFDRLKSVAGVRMEIAKMNFTNVSFNNALLMNDIDILPVIGVIYEAIPDKMNVRLNYNRTLARPAFREIADVAFYEFLNNSFLLGNPELKRTLVDNFDFRWEMFQTPGEKVTVSAFYKDFKNPIELTNNPEAKNGEWIYKNVKHATVVGFELDFIKKLDFVSALKDFTLGGNISIAKSKASIDPNELANIKYHEPDALDTRQLYGQSPYLINAFISYQNKYGTSARVNYNVQGERLYLVEIGAKPDVFEQPFNLFNVKVSQKITNNINISIGINNAFDDKVKRTIKYKENEYIFNSYKEGRTYTFSVNYDFTK